MYVCVWRIMFAFVFICKCVREHGYTKNNTNCDSYNTLKPSDKKRCRNGYFRITQQKLIKIDH